MTTKEVAQICGVTEKTIYNNANKANVVLEQGKSKDWTEDELKRLQLVLMKNQVNQGTQVSIVKSTVETISDIDSFKYSKEDICRMCNVSSRTFDNFIALKLISNRDFISLGSSHKKLYNENVLKQFQLWLMNNQVNQGVQVETVKNNLETISKVGLVAKACLDSPEAWEQFKQLGDSLVEQKLQAKQLEEQNKLLLEQKEAAEANYQAEKLEHQKDKELILHKYLTATQIKETILKEYGKKIVVSKAVKRIPLDDNDILYKPFKNGDFTGQQPVYHPNVLDKIREILG